MKVAVIGASNKSNRYSYQAVKLLKEKGHLVFPIHQRIDLIEGLKVYKSIQDVVENIDTITMYVGKKISDLLMEDIIKKSPQRIIFNPGAENLDLENKAKEADIKTVNACTLVMLKTGQF